MFASPTASVTSHSNDGARRSDEEILGLPPTSKTVSESRSRSTKPTSRLASNRAVAGEFATDPARGNAAAVERSSSSESEAQRPVAPGDRASEARAAADPSAASPVNAEEPESYRVIFDANPELRDAWRAAQAYREIFPDLEQARALQKIFPTAADAERATAQLAELERLDSMFLSNRPESLAELAAIVYRLSPDAFANLARVMAGMVVDQGAIVTPHNEVSSSSAPAARTPALTPSARAPSSSATRDASIVPASVARPTGAQQAAPDAVAALASPETAAARVAFFEDTNAASVDGVLHVIESQVDRLLPEGITRGARNRVVGEIYRELDATLRGNRSLSRQVREAFRSGALDSDHQHAIVGMVVGRARQALPGIAKKVIEEWTSSVLAASSARLARQGAAERRVDIAGAGPAASEARRPLTPADLDYAKLSDADILNL